MSDEDVLAQLVACVTQPSSAPHKARALLEAAGHLDGLARASPHAPKPLSPSDRRIATAVAAGIELGIRCCERPAQRSSAIRSSADVARVLGPRLRLLDHEQLWILALDATSCVMGLRRLAEGGRHGCAVLACDVLRAALTMGAASFVLAHNHPGGDPSPSRHDLSLTQRVSHAAALIGLPLVDHVIVTRGAHVSLLDLGLIDVPCEIVESKRATAESPPD